MLDDRIILDGCRKKKHRFQMALYDKYAPMLKGICIRYTNNETDAQDVLQEGFIKVLDNIDKYVDYGSLGAWMKRVMINHAINFTKKKKKLVLSEFEDYKNQNYDIESDDEADIVLNDERINQELVLKLVNELPEGYRLVINMYVIDGFSHKEIAEKLNISINTSKSQLSRARKKILETLHKHLNNKSY